MPRFSSRTRNGARNRSSVKTRSSVRSQYVPVHGLIGTDPTGANWGYDRLDSSMWSSIGTIPNVTLGTPYVKPMFETAGLEIQYTETTPGLVTAVTGEIRRQNDNQVRNLPTIYPVRPRPPNGTVGGGDPFLACMAPYLAEGGSYEARFTITDGTNTAYRVFTWTNQSLATRLPNWAATPTHYLSPSGSDAADGLTVGTPWRSLDKAILSAPSGAVVRMAPGQYVGSTRTRTLPLTIVATNPATAEETNTHLGVPTLEIVEANAGSRSVIEPKADIDGGPAVLAPTGATDPDLQMGAVTPTGTITVPRIGQWTQVSVTGETLGGTHVLWRCLNAPNSYSNQLCYSDTRQGPTQFVANWAYEITTDGMNSKERFGERIYLNSTYNYGYWHDGSAGAVGTVRRDIYAKFPYGIDPNTKYFFMHGSISQLNWPAFSINGPDVGIYGVEFRGHVAGVRFFVNAIRPTVQRCLFYEMNPPIWDFATQSNTFSKDPVIYRNLMKHTGIYGPQPDDALINWDFFKIWIKKPAPETAVNWSTINVGLANEVGAIGSQGGAEGCLIQENTITGYANGIGSGNTAYNGEAARDHVICRNLMIGFGDDPIEPEGNAKRWAVYGNRIKYGLTVFAFAPFNYGPIYFYENAAWNQGWYQPTTSGGIRTGILWKYTAGDQYASCQVQAVNNAFWNNGVRCAGGSGSGGGGSYGTGYQWLRWLMFNSLMRTGQAGSFNGNVMEIGTYADDPLQWVEDANVLISAWVGKGFEVRRTGTQGGFFAGQLAGVEYRTLAQLAAYRIAYPGNGATTNKLGGVDFAFEGASVIDAKWPNAASGDLRATHADFQNTGVRVRGFHFLSNPVPHRGFQPS